MRKIIKFNLYSALFSVQKNHLDPENVVVKVVEEPNIIIV